MEPIKVRVMSASSRAVSGSTWADASPATAASPVPHPRASPPPSPPSPPPPPPGGSGAGAAAHGSSEGSSPPSRSSPASVRSSRADAHPRRPAWSRGSWSLLADDGGAAAVNSHVGARLPAGGAKRRHGVRAGDAYDRTANSLTHTRARTRNTHVL